MIPKTREMIWRTVMMGIDSGDDDEFCSKLPSSSDKSPEPSIDSEDVALKLRIEE
jgi:hypothetical protein